MMLKALFTVAIVAMTLTGAAQASTAASFALDTTAGQGRNAVQVSLVVGSDWSRNPFKL